jgi:hypothetical protein
MVNAFLGLTSGCIGSIFTHYPFVYDDKESNVYDKEIMKFMLSIPNNKLLCKLNQEDQTANHNTKM